MKSKSPKLKIKKANNNKKWDKKKKKQLFDQVLLLKNVKDWLIGSFAVPRLAILAGIIGALTFLYIPGIIQHSHQPQLNTPNIDPSIPLQFEIPRLQIVLPIKEATVSANDWQVFDNAVSWLSGSGNLTGGNMVLYGHNSKTVFGSIIRLGIGDQISIKSSSGKREFLVEKIYQTNRWDLSAITDKQDQLTMYTCSGWFDANRWFVIAKPLSAYSH